MSAYRLSKAILTINCMKKNHPKDHLSEKRQPVSLWPAMTFSILFLFFCSSISFSQELKGKVTDPKGSPMPDVSVLVKGTTTGVTTDANGDFAIKVPGPKSVVVISSVGFQTQEFTVGNSVSQVKGSERLMPQSSAITF
jgi:hypothetical protein